MKIGKSFTPALIAFLSLCLFTSCQSKSETSGLPQPERHWAQLLNNNYPLWREPVYVGKKVLVKHPQKSKQTRYNTYSSTPPRDIANEVYFQESNPIADPARVNHSVNITPANSVKAKNPDFNPNKIEKTLPKVETETEPKLKLTKDIKAPIEVKNFTPLSVEVKKDISLAPPVDSENIELSPEVK